MRQRHVLAPARHAAVDHALVDRGTILRAKAQPLGDARAETFDDPFNEYNLPEAILRFRQGFGRLIRTQSDRGVVVILDKRILTKKYGRQFIESLPLCTQKKASTVDLPASVTKWLNI